MDLPLFMIWIRGGIFVVDFWFMTSFCERLCPTSQSSEKIQRIVLAWSIIIYKLLYVIYISNGGLPRFCRVWCHGTCHPASQAIMMIYSHSTLQYNICDDGFSFFVWPDGTSRPAHTWAFYGAYRCEELRGGRAQGLREERNTHVKDWITHLKDCNTHVKD